MARRLWRFVFVSVVLMGFLLIVLGIFFAGAVTHAAATLPGPISTFQWALPVVAIFLGAVMLLTCGYRWVTEVDDGEGDDIEAQALKARATTSSTPGSPRKKPSRVSTLLQARDFLPDEMPEGWSRPLAVGGSFRWMFDSKTECCALVLHRQRWLTAVRIYIAGKGTSEPVSDARCAEILGHVRHVGEFIEADPDKDYPRMRMWVALPTELRPRWRVPKSIPPARERVLSPHLVAARKYLPQKLPADWSVPVAIGDDHGTEWKDGAWMIATGDDRFIVVFLVTSKGRVKLSVTFFGADAVEVSEGAAAEMLRHFRGVLEFAQTEAVPGEVPTRTYLGEIAPEGGARVLLN